MANLAFADPVNQRVMKANGPAAPSEHEDQEFTRF
jgi:hypothetical protein